ncbi:Dcw1p [Sugiyamaella lignohabitans]|uniref:Mannan endo-1,6-alpha-mannosidase n=1 Tax=Sugiyamaella lignohabitans TaxID=796027 RepID=A0A167CDD3_9ASCO|nr:Dcw1p [Sugiyamaella lignohabitans]ANB11544.1 Dcw1p [Sugiyamaella lignohabitans]
MKFLTLITASVALLVQQATSLTLDETSVESIYGAQALVAQGLMDYYNGNQTGQTPGMFSNPYYWWEAGVAWGTMLDYWYYTQNDTYVDIIKSSMLFQTGKDWNYMPSNQTTTEGNDDQGYWGVTVMAAAEKNFSDPGPGNPSWLYLAQGVFNTMASRWDTQTCNGGLRWQIFTWNGGYDYKNSVANGCLFHIGARLARYTGNNSYVDWAERVWNWAEGVNFLNQTFVNQTFVYDGAYVEANCTNVRNLEWTYNYGLFISGCAYLYNYTNQTVWLDRLEMLWSRGKVFFNEDGIMYEAACQPSNQCNTDQRCFKGIYSRFLGLTMLLVPSLQDEIMPLIQSSAKAAAASCSGGTDGHTCGLNWFKNGWDGVWGLGEQICALDTFNTLLINTRPGPLTEKSGGPSGGFGAAGLNSSDNVLTVDELTIGTKDKAGAGVITAIVIIGLLATSWWMLI